MNRPNARRAALVARTELRRTRRSLTDSTRGVVVLLVVGLAVPAYSLGIGATALFAGSEIGSVAPGRVRLVATGVIAGLFGFIAFIISQRTAKTNGEPDAADGLLTTVPSADVLAGLLLAELARVLVVVALPLLSLAVGTTIGSGLPVLGWVVLGTTVVVTAVGTGSGYAAGLVVKLIVARSLFVARHRATIGAVTSILFITLWVVASGALSIQYAVLRAATESPLSWAGELVLLAVPTVPAAPIKAAVAGAVLLGALPLVAAACLWLAERVWYADPVQPDHEFDAGERTLSDRLLTGRVSTATRVVAQKSWLRAKRAPFTVQFAIAPFFVLAFQFQTVMLERTVPPTFPLTAGLATAIATGAAFTLNPLGGEEQVLPLTLTANVSGTRFLTGLVLAGSLPGVVLTAGLVLGLGVAAGVAPLALAACLGVALVATLTAPAIAAGAGVVFPKFSRTTVSGREVTVPSGLAFALYAVVLGVAVAPGGGATVLVLTETLTSLAPARVLLAGGFILTAVLAGMFGLVGFLYAANRVGKYRLD